MIETEETQIYLSYNTGGNEDNKTGTDTFTVITSAIRKTKKTGYFWLWDYRQTFAD